MADAAANLRPDPGGRARLGGGGVRGRVAALGVGDRQGHRPAGHPRAVDGADLAPLAGALGFVLLAAFGAVIATRGWVRRGLGVLVVVAALVVLVAVIHPGETGSAVEQGLSAKGWSGGPLRCQHLRLALARGRWARWAAWSPACSWPRFGGSWASMGTRYDAPGGTAPQAPGGPQAEPTETDLWRSIDSGHDPTQSP